MIAGGVPRPHTRRTLGLPLSTTASSQTATYTPTMST
ncbi:hypothetical protein BN444_01859 [Xanthomonas translucens pv. translucens DSM 18974]|uniref:Uncharacterized protein n=1 Tax=Xanthomonas translucens pv. translucens DSM 18974 TaxID=1261556 RepID=A0A1C3TI78_XANCT|nr:hypothetical protein BN444_01859 [Xanthomonas translucens pv. translucens DSM 18974]SCB02966.1 hypothetical protein BN444_01859 [Xanthomonas translucens pv. translucens DSM 18974]